MRQMHFFESSMTPIVSYYYKTLTDKVPARVFLFFGDWPARNIRAGRGNMLHLLTRPMTQGEIEAGYLTGTRMRYLQYESWPGLLEDEATAGVPAEHLATLKTHMGYCPLIPKKEVKSRPKKRD